MSEPNDTPAIAVTKTCPSLSGTSTLTYEVSTTEQDTCYRVVGNSAAGLFCKDWIPLSSLSPLLTQESISSGTLKVLFPGRSTNSAGFLLAVLVAEGMVRPVEGKSFRYTTADRPKKKKAGGPS